MGIDERIAELKQYTGCNPCPDDFKEFWDRGLCEVYNIDPCLQMIPAEFQLPEVECFHLRYNGTHGGCVYAKYLRPRYSIAPHPAVLSFHGYGTNSGDWTSLLPYVAAGFSVAAMDCRGQTGLSVDGDITSGPTIRGGIIKGLLDDPEKLLFRNIFLDTVQLYRVISNLPEVDAHRVGVTGTSQGGGLSLACAALVPEIKIAVVLYPFLSDYKMGWDLDAQNSAFFELKPFFRQIDPTHQREDEFFEKLGYIDVHNLAPYIRASTHMAITMLDVSVPAPTQFAVYNNIQASKTLTIYKDYGHEEIRGYADIAMQKLMKL